MLRALTPGVNRHSQFPAQLGGQSRRATRTRVGALGTVPKLSRGPVLQRTSNLEGSAAFGRGKDQAKACLNEVALAGASKRVQ